VLPVAHLSGFTFADSSSPEPRVTFRWKIVSRAVPPPGFQTVGPKKSYRPRLAFVCSESYTLDHYHPQLQLTPPVKL